MSTDTSVIRPQNDSTSPADRATGTALFSPAFGARDRSGTPVVLVVGQDAIAAVQTDEPFDMTLHRFAESSRYELDGDQLSIWGRSGRASYKVDTPDVLAADLASLGIRLAGATSVVPAPASDVRPSLSEFFGLVEMSPPDRARALGDGVDEEQVRESVDRARRVKDQERRQQLLQTSQRIPVVTAESFPGHVVTYVVGPVSASWSIPGTPSPTGSAAGRAEPDIDRATQTAIARLRVAAASSNANTVTGLRVSLLPLGDRIVVQAVGTAVVVAPARGRTQGSGVSTQQFR